ncbi:hypothetical protein ES702_00198 [subsurface metagenome]
MVTGPLGSFVRCCKGGQLGRYIRCLRPTLASPGHKPNSRTNFIVAKPVRNLLSTMSHFPSRSNTVSTTNTRVSDGAEAVPTNDPSSTLGLLEERLSAWKHMCGYLEDYVKAVAKDQSKQSKDSEKILKTLSNPLKEGHHFDQSVGGVASLFENLRSNTEAQGRLYSETEINLTNNVLPIFEKLHKEVKAKGKELEHGAGKQSKTVEAARNTSQKQIELLGQQSASFDSSGGYGKTTASHDPYVLQRGVWYRLNKQLMEENSHRSDLITIQNNFQQFENHVVATIQSGLSTFNQYMASSHDRSKTMYGDIASNAASIDPNFEWNGFTQRNGHILISPNAPPRDIKSLSFPNQDHRATKPLVEGTLERKSRAALGSYKSNYYAVTPAGYLHEYKDNDNFRADPVPEHSLYLPDSIIGAVDGTKFAIKGKDSSGSKISQKLSMSSEYTFRAHTPSDAAQWHSIIAGVCSGQTDSLPNSPISRQGTNDIPANIDTTMAGGVGSGRHDQVTGTTTSPQATTMSPQSAHPTTGLGGADVSAPTQAHSGQTQGMMPIREKEVQ